MRRDELQTLVDQFVTMSKAFIAHNDMNAIEERKQLLDARKTYADSWEALANGTEQAVAENAALKDSDTPAKITELRAQIRSTVASHQAKWPSVLIADDPEGYAKSRYEVNLLLDSFLKIIKREILPKLN
jgi:hypothetical protein